MIVKTAFWRNGDFDDNLDVGDSFAHQIFVNIRHQYNIGNIIDIALTILVHGQMNYQF